MSASEWKSKAPYRAEFGSTNDANDTYKATCFCGRVAYEVWGYPVDSKLCHCQDCQVLHGAPFEWVSLFEKDHVRFHPSSLDYLHFYNTKLDKSWTSEEAQDRQLPVKVRCRHCGTPVADEGRSMWLGYTTLFRFREHEIPSAFRHSCHMFYAQRCINMNDGKTKWTGDKDNSPEWLD